MSHNKLNTAIFIERAAKIHNNKYDYSKSVYVTTSVNLEIICPIHGTFLQTPNVHLRGGNCSKCGKDKLSLLFRKSNDTFIKECNEIHNNKYSYEKTLYVKNSKIVNVGCPIHGEFSIIAHRHLEGFGCPKCVVSSVLLDTNKFINKSIAVHKDRYDYSKVIYKKSNIHIDIICNRHGVFKMQPTNHINLKQGCPKCYMSKGESAIYSFFNQINLPIETQKMFKDCKIRRMLPFDFYVPKFNILIEYDGEFHYMPITKLGGEKSFKKTQETDRIKNEFAKANNIKLIRIPYWEFNNIENILKKELCI